MRNGHYFNYGFTLRKESYFQWKTAITWHDLRTSGEHVLLDRKSNQNGQNVLCAVKCASFNNSEQTLFAYFFLVVIFNFPMRRSDVK